MPKKDPEPRESPEVPAAFPIDQALIELFSQDPHDHSPTERPATFSDDLDWLDERQPAARNPAAATAATAAGERREPRLEPAEPPVVGVSAPASEAELAAEARHESPEARDAELMRLPVWQRRYVLGLRTFGVAALAAKHANVSNQTVRKHRSQSAQFDLCCQDALRDAVDAVEASVIQSATVGNVSPVFQGGLLVGYKRVKDVKAAALIFEKAGYLDPDVHIDARATVKVDVVAAGDLAAQVREGMQKLFAARGKQPLLDAETGKPVR